MAYQYDSQFMSYTSLSSRRSAQIVTGLVTDWLNIQSVLDIGCARGVWLSAWREAGVDDVYGLDGAYVDQNSLVIPAASFLPSDLSRSIDLHKTFDLVQSLEVAEHIAQASANTFVDNMVRHSNGIILFSAAPPGQGGEHHVNEQPYDYWREKFAKHGYVACDCIRPRLANTRDVSFWYRYNTILYVNSSHLSKLPADIRDSVVAEGTRIRDRSPAWFKLRKTFVRILPPRVHAWLARLKANVMSE